jgi:hypothetical protein
MIAGLLEIDQLFRSAGAHATDGRLMTRLPKFEAALVGVVAHCFMPGSRTLSLCVHNSVTPNQGGLHENDHLHPRGARAHC